MRWAATSDRRCPASLATLRRRPFRARQPPSTDGPRAANSQRRLVRVISARDIRAPSRGESMPRAVLTLLAISLAVTIDVDINAQTLDQDHGQYSRADVEAGQRLYGPQCQVCHGANGDGVPGIDLKLGRFRRASS